MCLWQAVKENKIQEARELQASLRGLTQALFIESNPIPVKWCLSVLWGKEFKPRLPLVPLDSRFASKLKDILIKVRERGF